jgi:hypothetical protein
MAHTWNTGNHVTYVLQIYYKDENKEPEEGVHKMRSGRVLSIGAFVWSSLLTSYQVDGFIHPEAPNLISQEFCMALNLQPLSFHLLEVGVRGESSNLLITCLSVTSFILSLSRDHSLSQLIGINSGVI